ncbi:ParB/RepB/Spo0J family partition protein [Marisediminicola sp. LYQ134]|uniref:ParB/RepB/Spo0J family partition protein n=1 Tax=Marisediminicola sp. LYQ134 TaxID=3391061 RepID=UPI00398300F5
MLKLDYLDPSTLVLPLDGNVRTDTKLDKHFLASVKDRGVDVPIHVVPNDDGGYDVTDGQRRTLAAVQAGLATVPVLIRDRPATDSDRVVDQLVLNDQRAALSDAEHTHAYKQLALFGLPATQIAKRTSTPIARVGDAITVANNEAASKVLSEYPISLEQAAKVAVFADDKKAVKRITETLATQPGQFDHVIADLTKKRELAQQRASLVAEIEGMGITRLEDLRSWDRAPEGWVAIAELAPADTPTERLTPEAVLSLRTEEDVAAAIKQTYEVGTYRDWAEIAYFVKNPTDHGFVPLTYGSPSTTPEQIEADRVRAEARAAQQAIEATRDTAREVRHTFIVDFLTRPTLPSDAIMHIAWMRTHADESPTYQGGLDGRILPFLGEPAPNVNDTCDTVQQHLTTRPKLAITFLLADAFATGERFLDNGYQPNARAGAARHLTQLRAWGYTLSDIEKTDLDELTPKPTEETPAA